VGRGTGSDNRWQGYSHRELYDMLHSGPGGAAAGPVADNWSGMAGALTDIQQEINAGVAASGASWVGSAGDSARDALGPLGDWAQQAATAADVMRISAELQGDLLGKARAAMPAPVPVPQQPGQFSQLVTAQVDYELTELSSQVAAQQAFQVMAEYEAGTDDNTSTLGDFGEPPALVVDTTPITGLAVRSAVRLPPKVDPASRTPTGSQPAARRSTRAAGPRATTEKEPVRGPAGPAVTEPADPTTGSPAHGTTRVGPSPVHTTPDATTVSAAEAGPRAVAPTPAAPGHLPGPADRSAPPAASTLAAEEGVTAVSSTTPSSAAPAPADRDRRTSTPTDPTVTPPTPRFAGGAVIPAARRPDGDDDEDDVHESRYLIEADDIYGSQPYSPPVIGESPRRR
jgi:hypothetical protein